MLDGPPRPPFFHKIMPPVTIHATTILLSSPVRSPSVSNMAGRAAPWTRRHLSSGGSLFCDAHVERPPRENSRGERGSRAVRPSEARHPTAESFLGKRRSTRPRPASGTPATPLPAAHCSKPKTQTHAAAHRDNVRSPACAAAPPPVATTPPSTPLLPAQCPPSASRRSHRRSPHWSAPTWRASRPLSAH